MDYIQVYKEWLKKAKEAEIQNLLQEMQNDPKRQKYCFDGSISFGTAGMRAEMDAGPNRMNIYTVARATKAVADVFKSKGGKRAIISYDSRINSELFAKTAAAVFAQHGYNVYITKGIAPTPVLSFLVRRLGADCGIMITASHNSKQYNGYKVYNNQGTQIDAEIAAQVMQRMLEIDVFDSVQYSFEKAITDGLVAYVEESFIDEYKEAVLSQSQSRLEGLRVVYSPLNGAGYQLVPEVLEKRGANIIKVIEQSFPNGSFTTCPYPNPEKKEALALSLKYAESSKADVLLANDPDCDRVGVMVRHGEKYVQLSGNELGILLTDYLLSSKKSKRILPENPILIRTIVSTEMVDRIIADYGGQAVTLLTGFKYIGEYINRLEKEGNLNSFVFAFEESCGYLAGTHARDKDGVVACLVTAEMCAEYKRRGFTLIDRLNFLYKRYGTYCHKQFSIEFSPEQKEEVFNRLHSLREKYPISIAGLKVTGVKDLQKEDMPELPRSDVLLFELQEKAKIILRPSGTEPLIKMYITAYAEDAEAVMIIDYIIKCMEKFFLEARG